MQIIRSKDEIKRIQGTKVVAMGNFDGVHKGHQALIGRCVKESRSKGWNSCVLTFEPHPMQVISKSRTLRLLNTPEQKYRLIASLGVDYLVVLHFDKEFAETEPEDFIRNYLCSLLNIKKLFIGFNFYFGRKGRGNPELLQQLGAECGFKTSILPPVSIQEEIVSSSLIKEKYTRGEVEKAAKLLGYHPCLEGRVVSGDARGRIIGFPTANLQIPDYLVLPEYGVYAATLEIIGAHDDIKPYPAVVNIGVRPTFCGQKPVVEVHILDYKGDLYENQVKINLIKQIRTEKIFMKMEMLQEQIKNDILNAKILLLKHNK